MLVELSQVDRWCADQFVVRVLRRSVQSGRARQVVWRLDK